MSMHPVFGCGNKKKSLAFLASFLSLARSTWMALLKSQVPLSPGELLNDDQSELQGFSQ